MNHESATPRDRAVDLLVFGPLGVAVLARDGVRLAADTVVRHGRDEVDRRRNQLDARVGQYRTIGQLAWTFGAPEARRRLERLAREAKERAEGTRGGVSDAARRATAGFGPAGAPGATEDFSGPDGRADGAEGAAWWEAEGVTDQSDPQAPAADSAPVFDASSFGAPAAADGVGELRSVDLAIPGYDELSAEQVVDRLDGLSPDELAAVGAYERNHRSRRTILGKLDHLSST